MWRVIPLALLQSLLLCSGQVMLKLALAKMGEFRWAWTFFTAQLTNWWFLGCGLAMGAATVLWMHILKNYPFGVAYPLTSMSYLFGFSMGRSAPDYGGMCIDCQMIMKNVAYIAAAAMLICLMACPSVARELVPLRPENMSCAFVQTKESVMLQEKMVSSGRMYFSSPDKVASHQSFHHERGGGCFHC